MCDERVRGDEGGLWAKAIKCVDMHAHHNRQLIWPKRAPESIWIRSAIVPAQSKIYIYVLIEIGWPRGNRMRETACPRLSDFQFALCQQKSICHFYSFSVVPSIGAASTFANHTTHAPLWELSVSSIWVEIHYI